MGKQKVDIDTISMNEAFTQLQSLIMLENFAMPTSTFMVHPFRD